MPQIDEKDSKLLGKWLSGELSKEEDEEIIKEFEELDTEKPKRKRKKKLIGPRKKHLDHSRLRNRIDYLDIIIKHKQGKKREKRRKKKPALTLKDIIDKKGIKLKTEKG